MCVWKRQIRTCICGIRVKYSLMYTILCSGVFHMQVDFCPSRFRAGGFSVQHFRTIIPAGPFHIAVLTLQHSRRPPYIYGTVCSYDGCTRILVVFYVWNQMPQRNGRNNVGVCVCVFANDIANANRASRLGAQKPRFLCLLLSSFTVTDQQDRIWSLRTVN